MNENEACKASHISKHFGVYTALKDVTLSVHRGEVFGFIGKNGAGKTTFMRILCGLMKPDGGLVEVKNIPAFLPQNVRFRDPVSAETALRYFAGLRGCDADEGMQFARTLELDTAKKIDSMSPGQQRKLQLAITTIGAPEVLVLDEPTAGLDPSGVQQVRAVIKTLHKQGRTVFISSHVLMELENLCDTVAVIEKGTLLYQGECGDVFEVETEGLTGDVLTRLCQAQGGHFRTRDGLLLAGIEKQAVPEMLAMLYENNVQVFGVRRQGIEALYNHFVKEGC